MKRPVSGSRNSARNTGAWPASSTLRCGTVASSAIQVRGVLLPRKGRRARAYLTVEQVELLVTLAETHGTLVQFLAYTGTRWGEATGLRVRNLDLTRRRARIEENAVKVARRIFVGTPKMHEARSVPVPPFLVDTLAIECIGKTRDQLVARRCLRGDDTRHLRGPLRR
nr:tyrosine-type recombinase/integrase [Amnibacterium sp.]